MSTEKLAKNRALKISKKRFLSISQLGNDVPAFVARFTTDQNLRCFGQTLINHGDGSYGIIIKEDGTIPRKHEAREILMAVSASKTDCSKPSKNYRVFATSLVTYSLDITAKSNSEAEQKAFFVEAPDWQETGEADWQIERVVEASPTKMEAHNV